MHTIRSSATNGHPPFHGFVKKKSRFCARGYWTIVEIPRSKNIGDASPYIIEPCPLQGETILRLEGTKDCVYTLYSYVPYRRIALKDCWIVLKESGLDLTVIVFGSARLFDTIYPTV